MGKQKKEQIQESPKEESVSYSVFKKTPKCPVAEIKWENNTPLGQCDTDP